MGGFGSGRRYQGGKNTTDDMRALDVRKLQRGGFLKPGARFTFTWTCNGKATGEIGGHVEGWRVTLTYNHRSGDYGEWQRMEYPVYLDWTTPHYGGQRAWFKCPARGCGRRGEPRKSGGGLVGSRGF